MKNKQNIKNKNIVFFDGVCNMCNSLIDFIIRKDNKKAIYYASLQSEVAQELLKNYQITYDTDNLSTIYFLHDGQLFEKSTAILKMFSLIKQPYPFLSKLGLVINKRLRDYIYRMISKNRYKLFGKRNTCRMPTKEEAAMFL